MACEESAVPLKTTEQFYFSVMTRTKSLSVLGHSMWLGRNPPHDGSTSVYAAPDQLLRLNAQKLLSDANFTLGRCEKNMFFRCLSLFLLHYLRIFRVIHVIVGPMFAGKTTALLRRHRQVGKLIFSKVIVWVLQAPTEWKRLLQQGTSNDNE
ncbi:hypothetical protein TRIUR3_30021 [Triticum urartu]|uniref:thymidine kinase n=1 Tax=Triticum urartu TaxID=4572 RepID=M8A834_TRIUA|nr:hypothetical protein TRIUR3_30021 [Triticum urartu]